MQKQNQRILIIGLGQIGYSDAEYIRKRGLKADGYDVDERAIQRALAAKVIRREAKTFKGYDYYLVCVSTHNPNDPTLPYFNGLLETTERISREGTKKSVVSIESTISTNVCTEVTGILGHRLHIAHVPHRYYAKDAEEHGVRQLRVLGGHENCCTDRAIYFYEKILGIPVYKVSSMELAALSKVVENSYRFLQIAFAEELKLLCDVHGQNFEELRNAVNTKWNVELLEARQGIGGHCLPKDTRIYLNLSNRVPFPSIIHSAVQINSQYEADIRKDDVFDTVLPMRLVARQK